MKPAIIVSHETARIMDFSYDFSKYAKSKGIKDPFQTKREIFAKHIKNGSIEISKMEEMCEPTKAEIEAYVKMREEYIADRVFKEIGYERFLQQISPNYTYLRIKDKFVPCKSADRQCNIFCHRYAECALEGTWRPE